jgi:hypothetical protein
LVLQNKRFWLAMASNDVSVQQHQQPQSVHRHCHAAQQQYTLQAQREQQQQEEEEEEEEEEEQQQQQIAQLPNVSHRMTEMHHHHLPMRSLQQQQQQHIAMAASQREQMLAQQEELRRDLVAQQQERQRLETTSQDDNNSSAIAADDNVVPAPLEMHERIQHCLKLQQLEPHSTQQQQHHHHINVNAGVAGQPLSHLHHALVQQHRPHQLVAFARQANGGGSGVVAGNGGNGAQVIDQHHAFAHLVAQSHSEHQKQLMMQHQQQQQQRGQQQFEHHENERRPLGDDATLVGARHAPPFSPVFYASQEQQQQRQLQAGGSTQDSMRMRQEEQALRHQHQMQLQLQQQQQQLRMQQQHYFQQAQPISIMPPLQHQHPQHQQPPRSAIEDALQAAELMRANAVSYMPVALSEAEKMRSASNAHRIALDKEKVKKKENRFGGEYRRGRAYNAQRRLKIVQMLADRATGRLNGKSARKISYREIAQECSVSLGFVSKMQRQYVAHGRIAEKDIAPKKMGGERRGAGRKRQWHPLVEGDKDDEHVDNDENDDDDESNEQASKRQRVE